MRYGIARPMPLGDSQLVALHFMAAVLILPCCSGEYDGRATPAPRFAPLSVWLDARGGRKNVVQNLLNHSCRRGLG